MGIVVGDINRLTEANLGGCRFFDFIDVNLCPNFTINNYSITTDISYDSVYWCRVTPTQGTLEFSQTPKVVNGIDLFLLKLNFVLPKHRLGVDRQLMQLRISRWIVLLYGENGDILVLGTKETPLKFIENDIQYRSSITQRNAYTCELSVMSKNRAAFYLPIGSANKHWESGELAEWEDGGQIEFENI